MSTDAPEFDVTGLPPELRVGIVAARYNEALVNGLLENAKTTLLGAGLQATNIEVQRVPGSAELPYLAHMMALSGQFDCIIALGVVIAGDTQHHITLERSTADAFQRIALHAEVPVINGVLTTENLEQANQRVSGELNRGKEYAAAALQMALHKVSWVNRLDVIAAQDSARAANISDN